MDNLVMKAIIDVHNYKVGRIPCEGFTVQEIDKTQKELQDRGYECELVTEKSQKVLVVKTAPTK